MNIISKTANACGAYPAIQSWSGNSVPDGFAEWPSWLDPAEFYENKGFVNLDVSRDIVKSYTPNQDALVTWEAEHPDPPDPVENTQTPDAEVYPTWDQLGGAVREGVNEVTT